jgi:hypothetical protein
MRRMAESAHSTADGPVEVLAYVDDDDPAVYDSQSYRTVRGPRIVLSDCWNKLANAASGEILQMAADDIRFRTAGWDTQILDVFDAFPDRVAFVYGRDGIHDEKLGTHGFVSREWVDAVGWFTWPGFAADFADTWLHDIAGRVGRRVFVSSLLFEHLHPIAGKAPWDDTHKERLVRMKEQDVGRVWREIEPERQAAAERLLAVMR